MAARAIWAGNLELGSSTLPVKLYSAVQDRSIRFHVLDAKTKSRVKQHMVDPETGEEVASGDIRKGYEVERGTFVLLDDDELSKLEPKASRDIEITRFVPAGRISHLWYEHPYYMGPASDNDSYFAFVEALQNENKEGVARWVMRNRPYVGALRVNEDYLVLITLKSADEVLSADEIRSPKEIGLPAPKRVSTTEVRRFEKLIQKKSAKELSREELRDDRAERLIKLVERKQARHKDIVETELAEHKPEKVVDLMEVLKKSLAGKRAA